ncbi:hypothetical protein HRR83_007667 [Exophiala dermatitidis]|uniref:DUF7603 domain-containing protein n=1 Tax=Exophiala dermatitidis TaxID=5970 RepID=A0AAN6EQ27_EXODE|nr:hypothetical protein HRR73_008964 [Exophiala dermatitidis]KAJ4507805.1 hypothetical protein HRR75_006515 [Exophiala dermatitidis]KAJ4509944.1 hypothetical protein HRR74_007096 [Exophiala dermatitidis]KAJ4539500.1 hypothetical protein HRR77_006383 [Exophiala dermatitidis]KAJ4542720.1 hypothetical protein HRR78_006809 [Exophiala dermatitidis]
MMDDNAHPAASFGSSPPPPPPKQSSTVRRISSLSAALKPLSPAFPVRRKPLPVNAAPAIQPSETLSSQRSFQNTHASPEHEARTDVRPTADSTAETKDTTSSTPPRTHLDDDTLARTTTTGSLPPSKGSKKTRRKSNASSVEGVAVEEDMGLKPGSRPPPVRTDSNSSARSLTVNDTKKPHTPGSKFTSFFTRKPVASPSAESSVTDISDRKSPLPSPYGDSPNSYSQSPSGFHFGASLRRTPTSQHSQDSIDFDGGPLPQSTPVGDANTKVVQLEAELREISTELANSIRREMDLEDLVDRLQSEGPGLTREMDRTSDYFSDSGTSSIRPSTSEGNTKEEVQRIKREAEQLRAQLKVEMSQKWQNERSSRQALESHISILEQKLSHSRRENNLSADISAKAKELEVALDDAKRRLVEERQTKENFEDLLTALRVELEQHRNERDNLRDEVVPQLRSQIAGLESSLAEVQSLRDENAALHAARTLNTQFQSIAEEGGMVESPTSPFPGRSTGLQRSNTIHMNRSSTRAQNNRSNSLSRSNSIVNRAVPENQQSLADQLKDVMEQRNALHSTVKYLLRRQEAQRRQYEKRLKLAEAERDRANSIHSAKKGGYEREVRKLRSEINVLRKRTDDALEQKWQCEKGLSGLKMDLDRSKQETASLKTLLQSRDETAPEVLSSSLEQALQQLQQQREQARHQESAGLLNDQELATELERSAKRSEALAVQVRKQVQANADLRNRLKEAAENGEANQQASAEQINELQAKLRKLEDVITVAQMQSETAVMKHEEEVRVLRASHNVQLMRTQSGRKNPALLAPTPGSPLSPMFVNSKKSPRLDQTSTGPGVALQHALKTEYLENKVADLEKALAEAEKEMEEVVGRMNSAQIGAAELESERDEALRQTRRLEAAIAAEREKVQALLDQDYTSDYPSDY